MDIGIGTAAAIWLVSGVLFWGGFVALGLRFRTAEEEESVRGASLASIGATPSRRPPPS